MSTLKKVISLVLCAAILVGSFAFVGSLTASVASAEEAALGIKTTVKKSTDANGAETTLTDVTGIMSYADLVADYGTATGADNLTDGFIYIASEYYEEDGRPTDYYIMPGDVLTARVYVKSNMYLGEATIMSFYDNSVWDVKKAIAGTPTYDANGYTSGSQAESNTNHPIWTSNAYKCMVTSINITNVGWIKNTCGFDAATLAGTDLIQVQTQVDAGTSSAAYQPTSDEWLLTHIVTLKDTVAEGTTVKVTSPDVIWGSYVNGTKHDARKRAYIPCAHITATGITSVSYTKPMAGQMDTGALDYMIRGLDHTFKVGMPEEAVTYNIDFYENDGTTKAVDTASYEEGEAAEFPAAAENQIAWAVIKEGLTTPGTLLTPDAEGNYSYTVKKADAAFMRVLADDKFNVELSLGAGATFEGELPDGATYDAEKNAIVIALPVGGTFDLSTIPTDGISKKDNSFSEWDLSGVTEPSSIEDNILTLGSVNGKGGTTVTAKATVVWETASYNVKYYLSKEAYEKGEAPIGEETVVANERTKFTADSLVPEKKFAGWYRADTNEFVNDKKLNVGVYTYSQDMEFYADWSDYLNTATFVIRDYEKGEGWKTVSVKTGDAEGGNTINKGPLKDIRDNAVNAIGATFVQLLDMDPDLIPEGETMKDHIAVQMYGDGSFVNDLVYSGHKVYYIVTTITYSITWKVPAYDANTGAFTEEYTEYPATASTAYTPSFGIDPYFAKAKFSEKLDIPTGWEISSWIDEATGEPVEFNDEGMYEIRGIANKEISLKAVYTLIEYKISFNLNNMGNPDYVLLDDTVTLGEEVVIEGKKFTLNGEPTVLPVIGKDSAEQPDGGYVLPEGYKFSGWTYSTGSEMVDVKFPVKLTADIINANFIKGAVCFSGKWEAKEYNLKFYILNADGEEELYGDYAVKVGDNLAAYKDVSDEALAEINAKAPKGKTFVKIWLDKSTGQPDALTKMPAKDMVYVASYVNSTVEVYIDYNNLATPDLSVTLQKYKDISLTYGQDITEVKSEAPYFERSFKTCVERSHISEINRPENASEIIGWNIYHVDEGDIYDTNNWVEGVNCEDNSNLAYATLIFQPVWKAHKDMFFRAYDTAGNIYLALGKDFKLYYWNTGAIVNSYKETQFNTDPENNIVLFFTIGIEWDNLTMTFSAFPIPKSVFTLEGMLGLFEMLGNLIGSLFA